MVKAVEVYTSFHDRPSLKRLLQTWTQKMHLMTQLTAISDGQLQGPVLQFLYDTLGSELQHDNRVPCDHL